MVRGMQSPGFLVVEIGGPPARVHDTRGYASFGSAKLVFIKLASRTNRIETSVEKSMMPRDQVPATPASRRGPDGLSARQLHPN